VVNMRWGGRQVYSPREGIGGDRRGIVQLGWRSVSVLWPPYAAVICAQSTAPTFIRAKTRKVIRYRGVPWEDTAVPSESWSLAHLASAVGGCFSAVTYVALGGLVLTARGLRQAIGPSLDPTAM